MNRLLVYALAFLMPLSPTRSQSAPSQPRLIQTLSVHSTHAGSWHASCHRSGFPIAASAKLKSTSGLALTDDHNRQIPASFEVLARHGGEPSDNSRPIRWLLTTFSGTGLTDGQRLRLIQSPNRASQSNPQIKKTTWGNDRIRVDISSKSHNLIRSIELDGKSLATTPSMRIIAIGSDGETLTTTPWSTRIENAASNASTLKATSTIGLVDIELQLMTCRSTSDWRGTLSLINRGAFGFEGRKADHQAFKRLALTLPIPDGNLHAESAHGNQPLPLRTVEDHLALLQSHETNPGKSPPESLWFDLYGNGKKLAHGNRAMGIAVASSKSGAIGLAVEEFAERAPRALTIRQNGMVLDIFPQQSDPKAVHTLEGSRALSVNFRVSFQNKRQGLLRTLQSGYGKTLHLLPSPDQIANTNPMVFPFRVRGSSNATSGIRKLDRLMELHVSDSAADPDPEGERVGLPRFLARGGTFGKQFSLGWKHYGDVPWGNGFCSLHYDWPFGLFLQYLRTGDVRFFEVGQRMARHRATTDQSHDTTSDAAWRGGQFYEKGWDHGELYLPAVSHTWLGGSLLHYLLTGDNLSLEAVNLSADFIRRRHLETWDGLWGARIPGWGIDNLLIRYDIFRDPADLARATRILKRVEFLETEKNGGQGVLVNRGARPAEIKPWMHAILACAVARHVALTGDRQFVPLLRRLLNGLQRTGITRTADGRLRINRKWIDGKGQSPSVHLIWGVMAAFTWGHLATGDPSWKQLGQQLFTEVVHDFQGKSPSRTTFRPNRFPDSESKIFSQIALWGLTATSLY